MIINEIRFALRDGREALIRSPREEDIPAMLEYLLVTAGETEFLLRYPEECGRYTPEGEKALFERINSSATEAMLVCFVDGEIAGVSNVAWSAGIKTRHRASIAIALKKRFWGQGIGTRLMREMERIALEDERVLQLELDFIEGNDRARSLYEKEGFVITGERPDAIRLKDGTFLKEYSMMKKIR